MFPLQGSRIPVSKMGLFSFYLYSEENVVSFVPGIAPLPTGGQTLYFSFYSLSFSVL
jgi:hypothetical protein